MHISTHYAMQMTSAVGMACSSLIDSCTCTEADVIVNLPDDIVMSDGLKYGDFLVYFSVFLLGFINIQRVQLHLLHSYQTAPVC